jgi:hypothetical protein
LDHYNTYIQIPANESHLTIYIYKFLLCHKKSLKELCKIDEIGYAALWSCTSTLDQRNISTLEIPYISSEQLLAQ